LGYVGRFAPSPTGPLHAGSLVAALASWLDARAAGGRWLVRIEDVDPPRCPPGAAERILAQLAACQLLPDEPPLWQSTRGARYQQALDACVARGLAYPCACTRRDIDTALAALGVVHERHVERPYPGTCRAGLGGRAARAWRFRVQEYQAGVAGRDSGPLSLLPLPQAGEGGGEGGMREAPAGCAAPSPLPSPPQGRGSCGRAVPPTLSPHGIHWHDRRLGPQFQDVAVQIGDFVLRRADGLWSYQLAVVVDDADQGITHVVRGEDLVDNTPRQILLQSALGLPTPQYLHTPLVRGADGEKLSKQHGAPAMDESRPRAALDAAARVLGLPQAAPDEAIGAALARWVRAWARIYNFAP